MIEQGLEDLPQNENIDKFLLQALVAQKVNKDPTIQRALRKLHGSYDLLFENAEKQSDIIVRQVVDSAQKIIKEGGSSGPQSKGQTRIYVDGGFDLPHLGHYNAIRQAKNMGDYLVVGVNSDEDLCKLKGPTVMNVRERAEILRHCKFIDKVEEDMPYTPTLDTL